MKKKHIHQYQRKTIGKASNGKDYRVYKCILPSCAHYVTVALAAGRVTLCNECGEPTVMGKYQCTKAKPKCNDCIKTRRSEKVNKLMEMFS
jgi:hypothetical protein